jgi:RNA polymerase sigma factor (sigma-70 family)
MPSPAISASFEQLALPLLPSLYSHAFWLSRNHAEAEDLVQETISKALRAFDSFQPGTNFKAWIFRILRNTFLTSRTGIAASRTIFLEDHPDLLDNSSASATRPLSTKPSTSSSRRSAKSFFSATSKSSSTKTSRWSSTSPSAQ